MTGDTVPVLCTTCGIPTRPTAYGPVHAEPRTLENNLHNGTPDHNATS